MGREAHNHTGSGPVSSALGVIYASGAVAVDVRAVEGNPEGWGFVRGSMGPRVCLEGSGGTQGRQACLEIGRRLGGLALSPGSHRPPFGANMGDLDQVSCGEAALVPRDLVDGACGDTASSVSPSQQMPVTGGQGSVPPRLHSPYLCPHCFRHLECPSLSSLPSTHGLQLSSGSIDAALPVFRTDCTPLWSQPQPLELNSYSRTDPASRSTGPALEQGV